MTATKTNLECNEYCEKIIQKINIDIDKDVTSESPLNRYFMPNYCNWLHKKMPHFALWSNFLLGDLKKFNSRYECELPITKANTVAEQFFCLKKRNRKNLGQSLVEFISNCWQDNP